MYVETTDLYTLSTDSLLQKGFKYRTGQSQQDTRQRQERLIRIIRSKRSEEIGNRRNG